MEHCKTCDVNFAKTPAEELCYVCDTGFYLNKGACLANPNCDGATYLTLMYDSYLTFNATCKPCPTGCISCKAQTSSDSYS